MMCKMASLLTEEQVVELAAHYAEMLGRQPADIGPDLEDWQKLVHPDDLERVLNAMHSYLDDERTVYEARYRMQTTDGTYRGVLARGEAFLRSDDGTPTKLVGVHVDIDSIVDLFAGFDVE